MFTDSKVAVSVGIGPEGESFGITVDIRVLIPGLELSQAQALVERTHQLCPYSKAVAGNVVFGFGSNGSCPKTICVCGGKGTMYPCPHKHAGLRLIFSPGVFLVDEFLDRANERSQPRGFHRG